MSLIANTLNPKKIVARAKTTRNKEIQDLEKEKKHRSKRKSNGDQVRTLLQVKGEPMEAKNVSADEMILLSSWKSGKKVKGKKADLLKLYLEATAPSKALAWSDTEEEQLTQLKTAAMTFNDTEMDTSQKKSANAVKANVSKLDDNQANELLEPITKHAATTTSTTATTTTLTMLLDVRMMCSGLV